jgi:hypothetical protein
MAILLLMETVLKKDWDYLYMYYRLLGTVPRSLLQNKKDWLKPWDYRRMMDWRLTWDLACMLGFAY